MSRRAVSSWPLRRRGEQPTWLRCGAAGVGATSAGAHMSGKRRRLREHGSEAQSPGSGTPRARAPRSDAQVRTPDAARAIRPAVHAPKTRRLRQRCRFVLGMRIMAAPWFDRLERLSRAFDAVLRDSSRATLAEHVDVSYT